MLLCVMLELVSCTQRVLDAGGRKVALIIAESSELIRDGGGGLRGLEIRRQIKRSHSLRNAQLKARTALRSVNCCAQSARRAVRSGFVGAEWYENPVQGAEVVVGHFCGRRQNPLRCVQVINQKTSINVVGIVDAMIDARGSLMIVEVIEVAAGNIIGAKLVARIGGAQHLTGVGIKTSRRTG